MFNDTKTKDHRLPPKADHTATLIAIVVGLVFAWVLVEYVITPEAILNYAETL